MQRSLHFLWVFVLLLALAAAPAHAAGDLVAAYSFDDGTGATLSDASGNGKNGTVVSATWTAGKFGSALSFDGTSSRVDLPALGTFYKTGFTLEAWVKKSTTKRDVGIVGAWDYGTGGGPMLWIDHVVGHYYATFNTGLSNYVDSGQSPATGTWQYVTATYDGTTARVYVNGTLAASKAFSGNVGDSNTWRIGAYGNSPFGFFDGLIDEVRIYNRALSGTEVTTDMDTRVLSDSTPPSAPTGFQKTGASVNSISTSWTASTDNVAVAGYQLYKNGTLAGTTSSTSFTFTGLTCNTSYSLTVQAYDTSGNNSPPAPLTASTNACDTTAPSVSLTAPAEGATVQGTTPVSASASDNDSVTGVQFKLDGANLGNEDTTSPYSLSWDTTTASPGAHTLTAVARDPSGNTTTSGAVHVTVAAAPAGSGPVAAYSFDDGGGTVLGDASGHGEQGTIVGATWVAGKYGSALSFDGNGARVDLPSLGRFYKTGFTLEAWAKKSGGKVDDAIVGSWDSGQNGGPMVWIDHIAGHYNLTLNSGLPNYLDSTQSPAAGTWQHIAATYDGSTARFYVNGVLAASKGFTANVGDTDTWRIGAYGLTPWGFFDGVIDEVRIYDRALNATQLASDMATPVAASLSVLSTTPSGSGTGAAPAVTASFNQAMSAASITSTTFQLRDSANALVPATVSYDAATGKASLAVTTALSYGGTYTATVKSGATGVKSAGGTALAADKTWTFTVKTRPPVLLVDSAAKPFSGYAAQILKAEGLNAFTSLDVSLLTSTALTGFDEVVLGDVPLTAGQVTTLTSWVNGGGKLVALHPDKQLAGLLGLTDQGATLSNAYLKVDTTAGTAGAGIVGQTIQFHGSADRYALNGATAVATLYSDAGTATTSPAVTLRTVGSGQAAAFTFDLARSVVYTRQGNPAWAGQERDGITPLRPDDLFFGAKSGDLQPDWVDLSKVAIPQADEQQRLLANLLTRMDQAPLPRFWYLPRTYQAAVVMSGDDHAKGGTAGRFNAYLADSPAGCSVADWECVRSTSYIYPASPLTDAQAFAYTQQGFEVALHISPAGINGLDCGNWTAAGLPDIFDTQLAAFHTAYPSLPAPATHRMHCVSWDDWATQAKVEAAHGIRMDTNYYYYPGSWMATKPGFMTGSGEIMKFADTDGSPIDVYQAATDITDESGQAEPSTINALLDGATGPNGYYGAFVANIHTDTAASADSDAIIASAQAHGVPVVSVKQMLDWVDGRDASSFDAIGYAGGTLTFTVKTGASNLEGMLPIQAGTRTLQSIKLNGSVTVPFQTKTIKGIAYGLFAASPGAYTATYS